MVGHGHSQLRGDIAQDWEAGEALSSIGKVVGYMHWGGGTKMLVCGYVGRGGNHTADL